MVPLELCRGPVEIDRSLDVVDRHDIAAIQAVLAIRLDGGSSHPDPMVLRGEPIPLDPRAAPDLLPIRLEHEAADPFARLDQVVHAELVEPVEVPPLGLGIAAVPVK